jgi:hypothetical protein
MPLVERGDECHGSPAAPQDPIDQPGPLRRDLGAEVVIAQRQVEQPEGLVVGVGEFVQLLRGQLQSVLGLRDVSVIDGRHRRIEQRGHAQRCLPGFASEAGTLHIGATGVGGMSLNGVGVAEVVQQSSHEGGARLFSRERHGVGEELEGEVIMAERSVGLAQLAQAGSKQAGVVPFFSDPAGHLEGHHGLVVLSDLLEGVPQVNQGLHLRVRSFCCSWQTRLRPGKAAASTAGCS